MRICIPSHQNHKDSFLSSHFGKATYMAIIDVDDAKITYNFKPFPHKTCGELALNLRKEGVKIIITNALSGRILKVFEKFKIKAYRSYGLKVCDALESFLSGKIEELPVVDIHHHLPNPGIKGGIKNP